MKTTGSPFFMKTTGSPFFSTQIVLQTNGGKGDYAWGTCCRAPGVNTKPKMNA